MQTESARLAELLKPECVSLSLAATTKDAALVELCELLARSHPGVDAAQVLECVRRREGAGCTGIGSGVAVPHGRCASAGHVRLAFAVSPAGVPFDAPDGQPVHLFFLLIGPPEASGAHLRLLSQIARVVKDSAQRARLRTAVTPEQVLEVLRSAPL